MYKLYWAPGIKCLGLLVEISTKGGAALGVEEEGSVGYLPDRHVHVGVNIGAVGYSSWNHGFVITRASGSRMRKRWKKSEYRMP